MRNKSPETGYNQKHMVKLWEQGKSINEIAEATGASEVWARRVISTKEPALYKAGLAARHAVGGSAPEANRPREKNGALSTKAAIEVIARAVAQAAFGQAQLVNQPMTRTEMFQNISKGVGAGIRKIGFHT